MRITPGIECHTHEYIQTGQYQSATKSIDSATGFTPDSDVESPISVTIRFKAENGIDIQKLAKKYYELLKDGENESLINKLRYFAYKESANIDAKEMTDLLDEGIRNIDKEELKVKLNEIYNRNRQLVEDYSADIDIGGVSIISLARE